MSNHLMIFSYLTQKPIELPNLSIPKELAYVHIIISFFTNKGELIECISEYVPNSEVMITNKLKLVPMILDKLIKDYDSSYSS